jgi:hypothetical protein
MLVTRIEGKAALCARASAMRASWCLLAPTCRPCFSEMGFISNSEDEAFLRDSGQRNA